MKSILLYGPENSSKYKKAMELILPYSRSGLKYKRKIEITLNGEIYYYNISDVHFEIDFELLGTNEHGLWYEFMNQVTTIVQSMEMGIIPIGSGNGLARHLGISMKFRTTYLKF